jgi:hypothetical protein
LEPSCGDGSFIEALFHDNARNADGMRIVGIEIDSELLDKCRYIVSESPLHAERCELVCGDFFRLFIEHKIACTVSEPNPLAQKFDLIIGNPPFGGSFPPDIEDDLDSMLGMRNGFKVKKETYAFFIVACTELLRPGGRLIFICSDSMLTIPTMTGLRQHLMASGKVTLHRLDEFSSETSYPMLVLEYVHGDGGEVVHRFGDNLRVLDIESTPNLSWGVNSEIAKLFRGPKLGDYFVASSGMTTGKNEYFVREIHPNNTIVEPFAFRFYDAPVSIEYERTRARLNKLPKKRLRELKEAELRGDTERRVAIERRDTALTIALPQEDYQPYNKANGQILYCPPTHVIYWKDQGDAVLTYKRTGNWYLRGVGGQPFFGKEGLTWPLIASRFNARYLPPGYILDSGAPCAFTRDGVDRREIFFVIGWLLSPLAKHVLKTVINHTMNIQSKDFERMPYPWWVPETTKADVIQRVLQMTEAGRAGRVWQWQDSEVKELSHAYKFDERCSGMRVAEAGLDRPKRATQPIQSTLF